MNNGLRFFFSLMFIFTPPLLGDVSSQSNMCPVHEAFFPKNGDEIVLVATSHNPPGHHEEARPLSPSSKAIWIPGYWKWAPEEEEFAWISGVWRIPPPGMGWIEGKWSEVKSGWVWRPGFWYPTKAREFPVLEVPPPSAPDEKISTAPSNGAFWVKGHWRYDHHKHTFVWFQGKWIEGEENWVFNPARYVWHDDGFVFVPPFWDWRIEERGAAYPCQWYKKEMKHGTGKELGMHEILAYYYLYWPDYASFFQHFSHFYPRWDFGWGGYPNWWSWPSWWGFAQEEMWALWWWWTHPGYPAPHYINEELAHKILPPGYKILEGAKRINPPFYVTKDGIVSQRALYDELMQKGVIGEGFVPASSGKRSYLAQHLNTRETNSHEIRPSGQAEERELESEVEKPFIGPDKSLLDAPPKRIKIPPVPTDSQKMNHEKKPLKMVQQRKVPKMHAQEEKPSTPKRELQQRKEVQKQRPITSNHDLLQMHQEKNQLSTYHASRKYPPFTYAPSVAYRPSPKECCGGDCSKQCCDQGCSCSDLKLNWYDICRGVWGVPTSRLSLFENECCVNAKNCYEMKRRASCIRKYDKQRYPGAYWDDYARWAVWHEEWQNYYREYDEWCQKQCREEYYRQRCERPSFIDAMHQECYYSEIENQRRYQEKERKKECVPKMKHRNGFLNNLWSKNEKEVPHFEPYYKKASKKTSKGRMRVTSPRILKEAKS
jgi:hypothetical protein